MGERSGVLRDETELIGACGALGAATGGGPLSSREAALLRRRPTRALEAGLVDRLRDAIRRGEDPLGEAFCALRSPRERRPLGAFYTPPRIVNAMVAWALARDPTRIVDAGCGSGRFAVTARRRGFTGDLVAVDLDPIATLMTRASLAAAGAPGARVVHGDFLGLRLADRRGHPRTAVLGNPPYVRHHELTPRVKRWAQRAAHALGVRISGLAGLHALFFLAAARQSRIGDVGCFITAAEWLDVGYGAALRQLLATKLGVVRLDVIDPRAVTFDDAMTTAAITAWEVGYRGPIRVRRVRAPEAVGELTTGRRVSRGRLAGTERWGDLMRPKARTDGLVPLGALVRVHRGVATGANDYFVLTREEATRRGLTPYVRPCLARAAEVITAGGVIRTEKVARVLLDLRHSPVQDRAAQVYLALGRRRGVPARYLCAHRRPWWRVGGAPPPPVVATYMARQPPVFATNPDRCQIVNVFHGLHFREPVDDDTVAALVAWLNAHRATLRGGRTYHGGLRKFEPRELEAIRIPPLEQLRMAASDGVSALC